MAPRLEELLDERSNDQAPFESHTKQLLNASEIRVARLSQEEEEEKTTGLSFLCFCEPETHPLKIDAPFVASLETRVSEMCRGLSFHSYIYESPRALRNNGDHFSTRPSSPPKERSPQPTLAPSRPTPSSVRTATASDSALPRRRPSSTFAPRSRKGLQAGLLSFRINNSRLSDTPQATRRRNKRRFTDTPSSTRSRRTSSR